jgi:hypothetical protein
MRKESKKFYDLSSIQVINSSLMKAFKLFIIQTE